MVYSTFAAVLKALKTWEDKMEYHIQTLTSIRVNVQLSARLLADNKAVCDSKTIPGNVMKKQFESIAYHKHYDG